jgi:HAD superfamily hydrolase (TIGR01450 family)
VSTWVIDLDGVVWRGEQSLPGSAAAVAELLGAGEQVVFCTNHAHGPQHKAERLAALGVPAAPVVTSAEAAAHGCPPGAEVLVLGDPSLSQCLAGHGLRVHDVWSLPEGTVPEVQAVVVGAASQWDRSRVGMAADAVRAGAMLLATNDDATFPVTGPDGPRLLPGNGALVAAVEVASGRRAAVAGKPYAPMASLLEHRFGPVDVVVGDKAETDGELARRLGARFGLVLSGVTGPADLPVEPAPWLVGSDLADLVARRPTRDADGGADGGAGQDGGREGRR